MARLLLALLLVLPLAAAAQAGNFGFEYRPNVAKVVQGSSDTLRLAFAGGLNTPQFSPIDLNGDGQDDLYAFDRETSRSYTFLNVATAGSGRTWQYAPDYEVFFPKDLESWVLLRDYDCDGRPDLFTYAAGGDIRVFRNVAGADGRPSFVLTTNQLRYTGASVGTSNLIIGSYNLPAIQDVNGDGRLDILTFEWSSSSTVELYLNSSPACGGLDFALSDSYWGKIQACGCTTYAVPGVSCRPAAGPAQPQQTAHTPGHSALLLDVDGNGSLDLVAGRDNCDQLATLLNRGSTVSPIFGPASPATTFAAAAVPVFPSAYRFDANFDGRPDIVVAPNMFENDEDQVGLRASVRLFANTAAGAALAYALAARPFLQGDMLDVSEQAAPAFGDVDGDGLVDMLIGNQADLVGGSYRASLYYYRNVGTARRPVFRLLSDDYLGLAARGLTSLRPAFADLNRDGAPDLIYGATTPATGNHAFYFRLNAAAAGQPLNFGAAAETMLRSTGLPSQTGDTAAFFDVDNDGFVDLLIGTNQQDYSNPTATGALRYFRNRGTGALETRFELADADFGRVRAADGSRPLNLAAAIADFDQDGQPDLLTVDGSGDAHFFATLRAQVTAGNAFSGQTSVFFNAQTKRLEAARLGAGYTSHPAVAAADLDGDGHPELLIGTESGGLLSYGAYTSSGLATRQPGALPFGLYPNPAHEYATLQLPGPARVEVFDLSGRRLRVADLPGGQSALRLQGLPAGLYLVRATAADGSTATRRLAVE